MSGVTYDYMEEYIRGLIPESEGKLKMPHSRVIGAGLFELRVGDKNIARTLYAYAVGHEIYLLHAFVKKTQKTPAGAIEIARKRLKEMS